MKKTALLLSLFLIPTLGLTQQTPDTLRAVILESKRLERPKQLIPTTIISPATSKRYNPADIVSNLNEAPGVFVFSGSLNTNRLTIRGIGSRTPFGTNKVKAYINQIPVTNGVGETSFGIFDPEALESIEVVKGPKATVYGSNLGGTLLLNPILPSEENYLSTSQTLGSFGQYKQSSRIGYDEEGLTLLFNYDHLEQEGYRDNNKYRRNGYLLNMKKEFSNNFNLKLLFNHIDYFSEIPSSLNREDYLTNPEKAANNWAASQGYEDDNTTLAGLTAESRIHRKLINISSVFATYNDHYEPRPFNILDETTTGAGFRSLFQYFHNDQIQIHTGIEYLQDRYTWSTYENLYEQNNGRGSLQGTLLSDNRENRRFMNAFTEVRMTFHKLSVQTGINYNNTLFQYRNLEPEANEIERDFRGVWSPNISLAYHFNQSLNVFINTAHGYSYPSLEETLNPEGTLNPEIRPESGWNYETGFLFLKQGWSIESSVYYMQVKDLLVARRTAEDAFIGRNAGRTGYLGAEYSVRKTWTPGNGLELQFLLNGTHNWHRFEDFIDGENDFSGNELTGVPEYVVIPGLQISMNNYYANLNGQLVGETPITDANDLYNEAFEIMNLRTGYSFQPAKRMFLDLHGGINNVFNTKYAASVLINATGFGGASPRYYYPGLPRNFFINLNLRYIL